MEPPVNRIGDVTIERVTADKKPKDADAPPMTFDTDSASESPSSDEEPITDPLNIEDDDHDPPPPLSDTSLLPPSIKRKQTFDTDHTTAIISSKKTKTKFSEDPEAEDDEDSDTEDLLTLSDTTKTIDTCQEVIDRVSAGKHRVKVQRTRVHSDNEDSEYDSEEDSDLEEPPQKEDAAEMLIDPEKTDFIEKLTNELGESSSQKSEDVKLEGSDYDYDITEKLKEMGEISVETVKKGDKPRKSESQEDAENEISVTPAKKDSGSDSDDKNSSERKIGNMRRNIREVMDETQLDEATLAAQRQEMERLRRVQEQQRIIREVQRQIALNRQNNKTQHRVISLLQGNSSIIKQLPGTSGGAGGSAGVAGAATSGASAAAGAAGGSAGAGGAGAAGRIGGTVLVKLPNGETKPMTRITKGHTPFEVVRFQKGALQSKIQRNLIPIKKASGGNLTPSVSIAPVTKVKLEPKTASDSESESSDSEKKVRKVAGKPKDVVTISSSSDDDCIVLSEEEPEEPEPDEDPCNSGMHTNDAYNVPDDQGRVLINVGHPENEADIFLAPQIARVIKPHQVGGVRFLYDNVIESTDRFSTSTGFGCILAHSMGLGKTLQVVCFSDIFLRHTPAKTILCIMPINTLQNWLAEYNMWLPKDSTNSPLLSHGEVRERNFNLYVLNDSHKNLAARAKVIQDWHRDGGVLLIGYELYRLLSLRRNPKSKAKRRKPTAAATAAAAAAAASSATAAGVGAAGAGTPGAATPAAADTQDPPEDEDKNKSLFEEIHEALVKPGPDLVICDEGHRIKNSHASISQALKQIRSKRRVVLTGYPLQNNLLEYWCMVDFVRPNYLGTKTEFSNMFERPIQNGQCIDSTPQDIRLMRYRAHVLHSLLEGFVQRRSHAVLQTSLPQKEEYVLLVRMTEFQRKLYDTFMNEVVRTKTVPNPLKAFAVCCKIWNHPDVLYYFLKKHNGEDVVDIDLEEVAGAAAAPNGAATPATPKKGSSRSKGGTKKEKKTAKSANSSNSKPAASVTPNTNITTPLSNTTTTPTNPSPMPNTSNHMNIPNPSNSNFMPPNMPGAPPGMQNAPNYNQNNPNYPSSSYQNPHAGYSHQNYPQYPQNGDYYNQNQNYPNNYGQNYYPNQEYSGFYDGNKPEGGYQQQSYQHDGQGYWNQGQNSQQQQQQPQQTSQYYNQNGPQNDYYGNVTPQQQQGGYGNQDYYRQNHYNQNYPQNNMYQPNSNNYPQNQQWPQTQQANEFNKPNDIKTEFNNSSCKPDFVKQEFNKQEFNTPESKPDTVKDENTSSNQMQVTPVETVVKDEAKMKTDAPEDEKKAEVAGEQGGTKEEGDEKGDKDAETKGIDATAAAAIAKLNVKEDPGIPYDWANELMKGYIPGCIENSAKMEIFFCILQESMALGDRILLFSQSLFTLNLIEEFLQRYEVPGTPDKWARNKHYYRLDGSTSALEREKLINEYNSNPNIHLFLVSTRAGSLGINLVGANRVIVFDASWNPCHDTQAVCRVYRYGQKKPCFVYRIVMDNCLEKKIYDRQINKQGMADRVVDECNPDAHLSMKEVTNLCWDDEKDSEVKDFSTNKDKYIDVVMQKVLDAYSSRLSKEPFQHESLLIDRKEKKLSQAEKRLAKRSYELEKQANINSRPTYSYYGGAAGGQGLQIRAVRTADGSVLQSKPVASVRPMQSEARGDLARPGAAGVGAAGRSRWIPAEVWQRQGMTAQEMTLPLDVVIPTNSPDRGSIVLKAGQKVLVLKSPKGIYMQLECGKIVAIKTAFKVRGGKAPEKGEDGANKDSPTPTTIVKKLPQGANTSKSGNVPLPLKNNSAITVIPKGGQQRVVKPFTQSVTKLNMRSIRQPVPNLVSRQVPMRMGGPRFTGKIQSIHRKVQLAKTKPYNLDKPGDSPKPVDPTLVKSEPADPDPDPETHIVPSSDEEIPVDPQPESSDKKDDESPDPMEVNESDQFPTSDMFSESEKSMETCSDMDRLSNIDFPEASSNRRQSVDSFHGSEKLSSGDSLTNLDQFSNPERFQPTATNETSNKFPAQEDKFTNPSNTSHDRFPNTSSNESFTSERFQTTPVDKFQPVNDRFPGAVQEQYHSSTSTGPVTSSNKYPNPVATGFPAMDRFTNMDYTSLDKPKTVTAAVAAKESKVVSDPVQPMMDKPKLVPSLFPQPVPSLTVPHPVNTQHLSSPAAGLTHSVPHLTNPVPALASPTAQLGHEQGNTNRSLKNYRHNFASQKAHSAAKPLPKSATTSSALHQLEQTTSSIGGDKQPFQESLDNITNSYGVAPPGAGAGQEQKNDDGHVIDLESEKSDVEVVEKSSKIGSKQPHSHQSQQSSDHSKASVHHHQQSHSRGTTDSHHSVQQHPTLPQSHPSQPHQPATQPQPQPHTSAGHHPATPLHHVTHHHQSHPPQQHGSQPAQHSQGQTQPVPQATPQQEYGGGAYGGYYGYGTPHGHAYPPQVQPPPASAPAPQSYYTPQTQETSHYGDTSKGKNEKSGGSSSGSVGSATTTQQSRTEQPAASTPTEPPASSAPSNTHHSSYGSTTAGASAPAVSSTAPGTPISTPGSFAPYGQPTIPPALPPPPPPHGAYDMMGYPQQNQYAPNYPGLPYPNQPNYQPPYQPPQYDQAGYPPPGPAPNMYSAFHRPDVHQYGAAAAAAAAADPYAAQQHYAAMRSAYPPQYPPYPAPHGHAQAMYAPAPPPAAPAYDYQYNANGFPPPPPFVNPYSGLPNNNSVP